MMRNFMQKPVLFAFYCGLLVRLFCVYLTQLVVCVL